MLALCCDFGVDADIRGVSSFFEYSTRFYFGKSAISKQELLPCTKYQKHEKENKTREPTKRRKKSQQASEKNPLYSNNFQTPAGR